MQDLIIQWGGIILGSVASVIATYHFKGKDALRHQLDKMQCRIDEHDKEITQLQTQTANDRGLLDQKLSTLSSEVTDIKCSLRDNNSEIKESIMSLTTIINKIAEGQGELRGTINAMLSNKS